MEIRQINNQEFLFIQAEVESKAFIDEYFALFIACFGERGGLDIAWYTWFNLNCPFGKNNIYLIRDKKTGQLAAAYGLLPYTLFFKGKEYKATLCTNVMVHPDYRGFGMFVEVGKFAIKEEERKGCQFVIGVPNENAIRGHMRVGWQRLPDLLFYEQNLNTGGEKRAVESSSKLKKITSPEELVNFHDLFLDKYDYFVNKTPAFLKWRFFDRPHKKYDFFILQENDSLKGYLVLKYFSEPLGNGESLKKAHILDFAYAEEQDFKALLDGALVEATKQQCDVINLWQINDNAKDVEMLLSSGFSPLGNKNYFINYTDLISAENCSELRWHFMLGDNDVY